MLYDRPVTGLMSEAVGSLEAPYNSGAIVDWFAQNYPKVKASTVRAHVVGMTANHSSRHHYPSMAARPPLLYRRADGLLVRFDPERHEMPDPPASEGGEREVGIEERPSDPGSSAERLEFGLEAYLEEFIVLNWELIDWGRPLDLWEGPEGGVGHGRDCLAVG